LIQVLKKWKSKSQLIILILIILIFFKPAPGHPEPIFKNNGSPLLFPFLNPYPESAKIIENKYIELNTSFIIENTLRLYRELDTDLTLDFEARRIPFEVKVNLFKKIQLSFNCQYVYLTGGFTDSLISKTHQVLHIAGRAYITNDSTYFFEIDEETIFNLDERYKDFNEPVIGLKYNFLNKNNFSFALKAHYKIPTDTENSLFSTDEYDYAGSILIDYSFKKFDFHLNLGKVFIGEPKDTEAIHLDDIFYGYLTTVYTFNEDFSAQIQLNIVQNPFRKNNINILSKNPSEILFGVIYNCKDYLSLELGFTQDITITSPEFGLNFGISSKF